MKKVEKNYDHRRTLSFAPFGYQSLDENGNILDVNEYWLDILGFEREEVIGKSFANFLTDEHAELFKTTFPENIKKEEVVKGLRLELVTKNGEKRIAEFTSEIEKHKDNSFIRTHCIFQDLTDIISKSETLERNQSHFNQAQKVGNIGSWEFDIKSNKIWGSEHAKLIYGLDPDKDSFDIDIIEEQIIESERVHDHMVDFITKGIPYDIEYDIINKKTKEILTLHSTAEIHKDGDGNPVYITGIIQDITERKKYQQELAINKNNLQGLIDNTKDLIWSIDTNYNLLAFNQSYNEFVEPLFNKIEIGSSVMDFKTKNNELSDFWKRLYDRVLGGESFVEEIPSVLKTGEVIWKISFSTLYSSTNEIRGASMFAHDVMPERVYEKELSNTIEMFKAIFDNAPALINSFDEKGKSILWNKQCEKVFGWTRDELNNAEDSLALFYPDKKDYNAVLETVTTNTSNDFIEFHPVTKSGDQLSAMWANFKISNGMVINIGYDITHQKETDKQLKQLSTAIQQSPVSIVITDIKGDIEYANNFFFNKTGYSAKEIIGKNPRILNSGHHPKSFFKNMWETVLEGRTWSGEVLNKKKNGETFWESAIHSPVIIDNKISDIIKIAEDITQKKEQERELKESHDRYEKISDLTLEGVILHKDGIVIDVNRSACKILKYSRNELIGKNIIDKVVLKDDLNIVLDNIKKNHAKPYTIKAKRNDNILIDLEIESKNTHYKGQEIRVTTIRDITDKLKTENELQDANKKFEAIATQSGDGVTISDLLGNFIYVNQSFCNMTQYTREELLTMNIQQLKPKNMAFNKFVESGSLMTNQTIEETHICKDGSEIVLEIVANYLSIDGNAYVLGTLRDITQKIKIRNELENTIRFLKDSETRFKILAENVPGTIYLCKNDEKFSMLYLNDTVGELTGFNKEEFLSNKLSFVELYHDEDKEMIFEKVSNALEKKEKFHLQYRLKHKSGNYIWVEEYGSGVYDGDKLLFLEGILIDVTMRINQGMELQQSKEDAEFNEKLYHSFIQNIQAGVVVHDPDTKVIFNNLLAEELLGLDAEQMRGRKASDPYWRFIYEDNSIIPLDDYPVNQVLKSEKSLESMVLGVYRGENDLVWLLVNGIPIFNSDNSIRMIIISFLNITTQKNSEILLQKNNRELMIAKEKAEQSDKLKSAFLSNMSHEIRTPLNGMLGFLGLIDDPNLSEKMRKNYIETINVSSNRLLNTIDDIICISRIESGAEIVQYHVTNPDKVITELIELYNPEAIKKDLELFFDNTNMDKKISIETDINKLKSILVNLIKNAIKFTDKGKITVSYKIEKKKIVFYVKDTGRGIDQNKLEFIFERFRQGEIGMSRGYEGSGLGLSICKGYVDLMGGDIWVESEIGRGSTFFFSIGINDINIEVEEDDNEYISEPVYPEKNDKIGDGEMILVVDDDNASFEFLQIILEDSNFKVIHAANGLEAVSIMKNNNEIIAILMDIKMPVMNGLDATMAIRKFNSQIPIIAQTAYGFSEEKKEAIDAGCNDYITKPIKQDELIDKLVRMISKSS